MRELVSSAIGADVADRLAREHRDRIDGIRRRNRDARHDEIFVTQPERLTPGVFERGDEAEIDLVRLEQLRAARRHVEADFEVGMIEQAVDVRARVQIRDGAQPRGPRRFPYAPDALTNLRNARNLSERDEPGAAPSS